MPSMEHTGNNIWVKECTVCKIEFKVIADKWQEARELMLEFFHAGSARQHDDMVCRCKSCNSNKRHSRAMDKHRDEMMTEQNSTCWLCPTPISFEAKNAAVDHCHNTGITRKILCKRCNFLMQAVDDSQWLIEAIAYRDSFKCE